MHPTIKTETVTTEDIQEHTLIITRVVYDGGSLRKYMMGMCDMLYYTSQDDKYDLMNQIIKDLELVEGTNLQHSKMI